VRDGPFFGEKVGSGAIYGFNAISAEKAPQNGL